MPITILPGFLLLSAIIPMPVQVPWKHVLTESFELLFFLRALGTAIIAPSGLSVSRWGFFRLMPTHSRGNTSSPSVSFPFFDARQGVSLPPLGLSLIVFLPQIPPVDIRSLMGRTRILFSGTRLIVLA